MPPVITSSCNARGLPPALVLAATLAALGGCATSEPRFTPDVATALSRDSMRRLETPDLVVYYAEGRRSEAERFTVSVGGCLRALKQRTRIHNRFSERKPFVILAGAAIDNAFVAPPLMARGEITSVVNAYTNLETTVGFNFAPDPAAFGCHEIAHWVHFMQMGGVWGVASLLFGDLVSPQWALDDWFSEGLATYYEGIVNPGAGRLVSPFWEGVFHSGLAGHRINGGDLSGKNRTFRWGHEYLVGSRFIAFLVERYGEEKLWKLVETQGRSIVFPLGVSLRYWQVYDKNLSSLIDEFADDVARRYPPRSRPANQRIVRQLGSDAHYAVGRNGTEAIVHSGLDQPARLEVFAPDGHRLARRSLQEVILPRKVVEGDPVMVSGLSVTGDGSAVYFALIDQGVTFRGVRLFRYHVTSQQLELVTDDLGGPGGAIADDGSAFFFTPSAGDRRSLAELDLTTRRVRVISPAAAGVFYATPRPSPDGRRLLVTVMDKAAPRMVLIDRASGNRVGPELTPGGANATVPTAAVDGWFIDDRRVVFVGERDRRFQIYLHDSGAPGITPVTTAPYLALAPRPTADGKLRFLNRDGWRWTVDEVALPPVQFVAMQGAAAPSGAQVAAAPGVAAGPPEAEVKVLSDNPYSTFERLFVPQLHSILLSTMPDSGRDLLGLTIGGGDRLSMHQWQVAGFLDFSKDARPSGRLGYSNSQLAPLTISLQASHFDWWDRPHGVSEGDLTVDRRARELLFTLQLPFVTHTASLSLHATEERSVGDPMRPGRRRLGGATGTLDVTAFEGTPYTGARRGLGLNLTGSVYPDPLGSQPYTFGDLRAELRTRLPVPPSSRLTFGLDLRARSLAGAPRGSGLLELGGTGTFNELLLRSSGPEQPDTGEVFGLLPTRFQEPLRGYEDLTFPVDRVAIAESRVRYPLIIDRGVASTFALLPALFVSQIDAELFGAAAWDTREVARSSLHASAGAAVTLRLNVWLLDFAVRYQFARRLVDDQANVHFVGLGIGQ